MPADDEPAPEHYVAINPVINGPRVHVPGVGRVYTQDLCSCLCGWQTVSINQLSEAAARQHVTEATR